MNWMNVTLFVWFMISFGVFIHQQTKDKSDKLTLYIGTIMFTFLAVISIFA